MDVYRPLRAVLFFYEILRIFLLVVLLIVASPQGSANGAFFPYLVYASSGALFPLMALFVWLRPADYHNYLSLYIAGKIIGTVLFVTWAIFSSREVPAQENLTKSIFLLGCSFFIGIFDVLSVWGAWKLKNKMRLMPAGALEMAGRAETGGM